MSGRKPRIVPLELPDDEELVLARAARSCCSFCGGAIAWDGVSGAMFAASSPAQRRAFMEALEGGYGPSWSAWWCTVPGCDGVGIFSPSSRIVH